jgi:hypothetical protein
MEAERGRRRVRACERRDGWSWKRVGRVKKRERESLCRNAGKAKGRGGDDEVDVYGVQEAVGEIKQLAAGPLGIPKLLVQQLVAASDVDKVDVSGSGAGSGVYIYVVAPRLERALHSCSVVLVYPTDLSWVPRAHS